MAESGNNSGTDRQTHRQTDRQSNWHCETCVATVWWCRAEKQWSRLVEWSRWTDRLSVKQSLNKRRLCSSTVTRSSVISSPVWLTASSVDNDIVSSRHFTRLTTLMYSNGKHSSTLQPDKQTQTSQTLQHLTTRQTNIPTPHKQTTNTALTATPHNQITLNTSTQRQLTITTESLYTILTHRNNNVSRAGLGYRHNMWPIITYVWWDLLASETKHH